MRVLFVSSTENSESFIAEILKGSPFESSAEISIARSAGEARRICSDCEFDTVIINSPLSDEFGPELAYDLAEDSCSGVLLLGRAEVIDAIREDAEFHGIIVVNKPVQRSVVFQAMHSSSVIRNRLITMRKKNSDLQKKLDETRLVGKAKCLLVQYADMTESDAHHYIEKEAMNNQVSRKAIAEGIISIYS